MITVNGIGFSNQSQLNIVSLESKKKSFLNTSREQACQRASRISKRLLEPLDPTPFLRKQKKGMAVLSPVSMQQKRLEIQNGKSAPLKVIPRNTALKNRALNSHTNNDWPLWKWVVGSVVLAVASAGTGILLRKVVDRFSWTPLQQHYFPDSNMCSAEKGIFSIPTKTCNPLSEGCSVDPNNRFIEITSVYDNSQSPLRDHFTNLTNTLNTQYANTWKEKGLHVEHRIIPDGKKLVANQCTDPITNEEKNCELYWVKVPPFLAACENQEMRKKISEQGAEWWVMVPDTDMMLFDHEISPNEIIDGLRQNPDGSFNDASLILPTDSHPYPGYYMSKHSVDPRNRPNTGLILGRIDERACQVYNKWWESRNSIPDRYNDRCRTLGICPGQSDGLHEQQGIAKVVTDHPCLFDHLVTVTPVRNPESKSRAQTVVNCVLGHHQYYYQKCDPQSEHCDAPFSFPESSEDPHVCQPGDRIFCGQPNATPAYGRKKLKSDMSRSAIAAMPKEEVRLNLMLEACAQHGKGKVKEICEGMALETKR